MTCENEKSPIFSSGIFPLVYSLSLFADLYIQFIFHFFALDLQATGL